MAMDLPSSAYQSTTPCSCATLKRRWDEHKYRLHRSKVASARSYVDNKPPKVYPHLYERLNKYVMEEQRMATIQKNNYLLLIRMAEIMQGKGIIDNYNDYQTRSLNGSIRQREVMRIAQENRAILARIDACYPHYSTKKFEREWQDRKIDMAFIGKYPPTGIHYKQKLKLLQRSRRNSCSSRANKRTP